PAPTPGIVKVPVTIPAPFWFSVNTVPSSTSGPPTSVHVPAIEPTMKSTLPDAVPPFPSLAVTVARTLPPGPPKSNCTFPPGNVPLPTLQEYVSASPSGSDPVAAKLKTVRSAIPNVGVTCALLTTGLRLACGWGCGDGPEGPLGDPLLPPHAVAATRTIVGSRRLSIGSP